jgi:hypothetical protein
VVRAVIKRFTTGTGNIVRNPKDELKIGMYYAMLNQLGIPDRDLRK